MTSLKTPRYNSNGHTLNFYHNRTFAFKSLRDLDGHSLRQLEQIVAAEGMLEDTAELQGLIFHFYTQSKI